MRKNILIALGVILLTGCAHEYNQVFKTSDYSYKYEYAKQCFAEGKYSRATPLLQDLITIEKGTENGQESLYMLGMSEYGMADYEGASATFDKYYKSYPNGQYAQEAAFYKGQSLYMSTPEPRLDQSATVSAIAAFQEYLDLFPEGKLKGTAQQRMIELQDKLVKKEYLSAQLYYNLGTYFGNCTSGGNNYQACIVTSQNALNSYPYSNLREEFAVLIMKSKYYLAQMSVESKKLDRYQDAEDECYGFINQYPDSKERKTAEEFIEKCKEVTKN